MAKFTRISKLSQKEEEALLIDFCRACTVVHNPLEAAQFLKDLLTEPEVGMLAKRLKIAQLLLEGWTYDQIKQALKVSNGTIGRIGAWLKRGGDGFKLIYQRTPKSKEGLVSHDIINEWEKHKRTYSQYYWPFLLWERLEKEADWRQKQKFRQIFSELKDKTKLYRELSDFFKRIG